MEQYYNCCSTDTDTTHRYYWYILTAVYIGGSHDSAVLGAILGQESVSCLRSPFLYGLFEVTNKSRREEQAPTEAGEDELACCRTA